MSGWWIQWCGDLSAVNAIANAVIVGTVLALDAMCVLLFTSL
jgi:hypothetical protein